MPIPAHRWAETYPGNASLQEDIFEVLLNENVLGFRP